MSTIIDFFSDNDYFSLNDGIFTRLLGGTFSPSFYDKKLFNGNITNFVLVNWIYSRIE